MPKAPVTSGESARALALKGRPVPWGPAALVALGACTALALWLRLNGLAQEGFSDDELHKWLAANRYLSGDFGGDDLEHPMLMKSLIALTLIVGRRLQWAPETITRLPNAIAGTVAVVVIAFLGRRLFGRVAGLFAAALGAVAVTWIGYQRIAKEDVLFGLSLLILCLCVAEAKASVDGGEERRARRFEWAGAAALAGTLASKYYLVVPLVPIIAVLWIGRTETAYHLSLRRWLQLALISFAFWVGFNWMILRPSTLRYIIDYLNGATHGGRATHLTMLYKGRLYANVFFGGSPRLPTSFFVVFAAVKQTPGLLLLSLAGLAWAIWKRYPSHRVVLAWMGVWFVGHAISQAKYARFFVPIYPSLFLLAGSVAARLIEWVAARRSTLATGAVASVLGATTIGPELAASLSHAPHFRTYISPLAGGDRCVTYYFPHCDYFDAGFREAMEYIAQHAERGAEVSSEIDWTARYYAERFGRDDLTFSILRPDDACRAGKICYVAIQEGRLYEANRTAVESLALRKPWHIVPIRGVEVVKVYRLAPGETPFPNAVRPASR